MAAPKAVAGALTGALLLGEKHLRLLDAKCFLLRTYTEHLHIFMYVCLYLFHSSQIQSSLLSVLPRGAPSPLNRSLRQTAQAQCC